MSCSPKIKKKCYSKKFNPSEEIGGRERKGEEPKGGVTKDRLNTNLNPTHWMNHGGPTFLSSVLFYIAAVSELLFLII